MSKITNIEPIDGAYGTKARITIDKTIVVDVEYDKMGRTGKQLSGYDIEEEWYCFSNGAYGIYIDNEFVVFCAGFTKEEDDAWRCKND